MSWLVRLFCGFLGGMLAATGLVMTYVYLLGAPDLPQLPIIGLPHTYVAAALLLAWSIAQGYLTLLGLVADGLLSLIGWRRAPRAAMALFHGALATALLLLAAWWFRPSELSTRIAFTIPFALQAAIRLLFGRLPDDPPRRG